MVVLTAGEVVLAYVVRLLKLALLESMLPPEVIYVDRIALRISGSSIHYPLVVSTAFNNMSARIGSNCLSFPSSISLLISLSVSAFL